MDPILESVLKPLLQYLDPEYIETHGLMEINCNEPGELWLEFDKKGYEAVHIPELTLNFWGRLFNVLAASSGQLYHPDKSPTVSVKLPGGHRFQGIFNNLTYDTGISVSIRLKRDIDLDYADFGITPAEEAFLKKVISQGGNIVVSGGTSSGKTSLANIFVKSIPLDKRVLLIEDTREIDLPHRNKSCAVVPRNETENEKVLNYDRVIDHAMRSRPDQILLGEISNTNVNPCLFLLCSGHRGLLTTIHADSPSHVLKRAFAQRMELTGAKVDRRDLTEYLEEAIDVIVQVQRTSSGARRVTEIWTRPGLKTDDNVHLFKAA